MPASTPLPYATVTSLSAFDMIDSMGTNTNIAYQIGGTTAADLPNRDGEIELISALQYLGIHHIRNAGLDANPNENAGTAYPNAPSDYQNFLTIRNSIPNIKIDFVVDAGGPPYWGDGTASDMKIILLNLAQLGALAAMEGPNEPNNQTTYSPSGSLYPPGNTAYNQIWTDWGVAFQSLKNSSTAFTGVLILPPTSAVTGPNGADGVEATYATSGLTDHTAYYDLMNFHSYSSEGLDGLSLGDPHGAISNGNPPNSGCYQVSIPNWGRYAMPGKRVVITESGNNTALVATGGLKVSERAQGVALVSNYFWAKYFNALRLYQYEINDDSNDLSDSTVVRWGFYRGDWSKKVAADYVHNFTSVLADTAQSDPSMIPSFTVSGKNTSTWGATLAFSKSDGSYVIACNNTLQWWNATNGGDLTPIAENWTITFSTNSTYTITDVMTGVTSAPQTGLTAAVAVRGYPMLVHVTNNAPTVVVLTNGTSWTVPAGVTKLSLVECTGGGGGGAMVTGNGGGNGGGGGAYAAIANFTVTPGASIPYKIGAGGAGGGNNGSSPGGAGGTTFFSSASSVSAVGGKGGVLTNNTVAAGGSATNCVGTMKFSGGNGGPNTTFGAYGAGGGGAASAAGAGNAGHNDNTGAGGSSPGGGAGGVPDGDGVSSPNGGGGGGGVNSLRCGNGGTPGGGGGGDGADISSLGGIGGQGQVRITYSN